MIMDNQDRVLLLLRPKEAYWAPDQWGYPGGKLEEGEAPKDAAMRETEEETTLKVSNLKEINLGVDMGVVAYYTHTYSGEVQIDHEHEDWRWMSRSDMDNHALAPNVLRMYEWVLNNE